MLSLLTGCGNKITCKISSSDKSITEQYNIKYEGDKITSLKNKKTYKFNNKEEFKKFEAIMIHYTKTLNNDNTKINYKKKNKKYILNTNYNLDKIDEDESIELGISKNKEELINKLKDSGFKCK